MYLKITGIFNQRLITSAKWAQIKSGIITVVTGGGDDCHGVERMLTFFAFLLGGWFLLFEVYPPNDSFGALASKNLFWFSVFATLGVIHTVAQIVNSRKVRLIVCLAYAVVWGAWAMLAATTVPPTFAAPLFFGLAVMSFYEALRLKPKNE